MRVIVDWRLFMAHEKFLGTKDTKSCVSSAYRRWEIEKALMRELRWVVKRLKRTGLRTKPSGTPQVRWDEGKLCGGIPIIDVQNERYEVNHCSETEEMSNQVTLYLLSGNNLPHDVRETTSMNSFRTRFKTFYFKSAYWTINRMFRCLWVPGCTGT